MIEMLALAAIAAWFIFWGWMLVNKPDTFFKVNDMGQKNLGNAGRAAAKAARFGLKVWPKR